MEDDLGVFPYPASCIKKRKLFDLQVYNKFLKETSICSWEVKVTVRENKLMVIIDVTRAIYRVLKGNAIFLITPCTMIQGGPCRGQKGPPIIVE